MLIGERRVGWMALFFLALLCGCGGSKLTSADMKAFDSGPA